MNFLGNHGLILSNQQRPISAAGDITRRDTFSVLTNPRIARQSGCDREKVARSRLRVVARRDRAPAVTPEIPGPHLLVFPARMTEKKPPRSLRTLLQSGLLDSVEVLGALTL